LAKEIADRRQEKRRTRPSKDSGPDAVAKHAAVLAKLGAVMTKAEIAYRHRELEAPMVVHEIKEDTTALLNNSARIEAKVDDVLDKMKDLHRLHMKGIAKGENAESMIAQASMMQTSGKALEKSAKATRAEEIVAAKAVAKLKAAEEKTAKVAEAAAAKAAAKATAKAVAAAQKAVKLAEAAAAKAAAKAAAAASKKAAKEAAEAEMIQDAIRNR
jgi:hypothetical protein